MIIKNLESYNHVAERLRNQQHSSTGFNTGIQSTFSPGNYYTYNNEDEDEFDQAFEDSVEQPQKRWVIMLKYLFTFILPQLPSSKKRAFVII